MKKVLVIATSFSPANAIGAVRTTKMIKNIVNLGWEITIITPKLDDNIDHDNTLFSEEINRMNKHVVPYSNYFNKIFLARRNKILINKSAGELIAGKGETIFSRTLRYFYRTAHFFYNIIRNYNWKKQVIKYFDLKFTNERFDVLITTYPSLSSHLIGLYMKKNKKICKWIADFQDPIAYEVLNSPMQFRLYSYLQKKICRNADAVTAVTKGLLRNLRRNGSEDKPYEYIPMSFDIDDIPHGNLEVEEKVDQDLFNITYVGSLYGGQRDISVIFMAIHKLHLDGKMHKSKIRFNYAGKEFPIVVNQAKPYDCKNILNNLGLVNRKESIKLQLLSDINVVVSWNTQKDRGVIPGKLYEAFLVKKKILGLIWGSQENSELKEMIERSGLGAAFEKLEARGNNGSQIVQISEFLLSNYESKKANKTSNPDYNQDYVESFEQQIVSKKLVQLMESLF